MEGVEFAVAQRVDVDDLSGLRVHDNHALIVLHVTPSFRVLRGSCRWGIMKARPSDLLGCGDRLRPDAGGRFFAPRALGNTLSASAVAGYSRHGRVRSAARRSR